MGRKKKNLNPDLLVAIDFGGSATKVVAMIPGGQPILFWMTPEVIELDKDVIQEYEKNKWGEIEPEFCTWVGIKDKYAVVGHLAKVRFLANARLSQLKYELGVYKTLGVLFVLKEKLGLASNFNPALSCLLPPGEYPDADKFEQLLRDKLGLFETPSGALRVKMTHFDCKPEGAGVMSVHRSARGQILKHCVCVLLMMGYRNSSVLVSNRGALSKFQTSDFGMVKLVEGVMARTSGLDASLLPGAIFQAGDEVKSHALLSLVRSRERTRQQQELQEMREAITAARKEYLAAFKSWLSEVLPRKIDEVIFCGGTVDYLLEELKAFFSDDIRLYLHANLHKHEGLQSLANESWRGRFADVYGLFEYLQSCVTTKVEEVKQYA